MNYIQQQLINGYTMNYRELRIAFSDWLQSDNVIKTNVNEFTFQCSQYSIRMTLFKMYRYFIREYGLHYID